MNPVVFPAPSKIIGTLEQSLRINGLENLPILVKRG
jgi:hypothetical protein